MSCAFQFYFLKVFIINNYILIRLEFVAFYYFIIRKSFTAFLAFLFVPYSPVVIFMKGTPDFPQCGFSARASQALAACGEKFAAVNIFENPEVHRNLPAYSNWPTFPL